MNRKEEKNRNLATILRSRIASMADRPAMLHKPKGQTYESITWSEMGNVVEKLAFGLSSLGIDMGAKVAIFSQTSHFWVLADFATIYNGAVSVPIYPTSSLSDIEYIINNSEAEVVFVQNQRLLKKFDNLVEKLPSLKKLVLMEPDKDSDLEKVAETCKLPRTMLMSFSDLILSGEVEMAENPNDLQYKWSNTKIDDLATIIYTSGTTGTPKGVPLTHSNIIRLVEDLRQIIPIGDDDLYLSYLPLSHVFERICGEFYWMMDGGSCAYAEGIEYMARNMQEVEPTMILVVPRVLDRIYTKVKNGIDGASARARKLIEWGVSVGNEMVEHAAEGKEPRIGLKAKYFIAERLVLRKLKERLGARLRLIVSGGAPATRPVLKFFNAVGISTLEGYGLTETAAPLSVNRPDKVKVGTVGCLLPSVQMKVDVDGELLVKGPTIFKGYYKNAQATEKAFVDGWFRTGDIGTIDGDNYVTITDRKKDIIVNAAGKNIAPQRIEAVLKTIPFINQAVVFGDKQKHLVALISLDETAAMDFSMESGWKYESFEDLLKSHELNNHLRSEIKRLSRPLADYEQVKKFKILENELSVEAGELTATLKIKRNVVARNYAQVIEALFDERSLVSQNAK